MAVNGFSGQFVIVALFFLASISVIDGVSVSSVSVTNVTKKEGLSSLSKSLSKISLPQVPVPEFPKFVSRPAKNPSSQSQSQSQPSNSNSNSNNNNNQQQQQYHQSPSQSQQQQQHHQSPSHSQQQPVQSQQQPAVSHQSSAQSHQVHSMVPSIQHPSPTSFLQELDDDLGGELQEEIIIAEAEHEYQDGFTPSENYNGSPQQQYHSQEKYHDSLHLPQPAVQLPSLPAPLESPNYPVPPKISLTGVPTSTTNSANQKNDTGKTGNQFNGEKFQENPGDFPMPMHVMTILQALGSGGSLAQASKPEKDSAGHGYTTANAIGYATGDNATVTASVSNKMEVNTQTVILTESATASASSLSNGTAFSQATLSSNGWASQMNNGNPWPSGPGSGWAKASHPNKKGRKLSRPPHKPLLFM